MKKFEPVYYKGKLIGYWEKLTGKTTRLTLGATDGKPNAEISHVDPVKKTITLKALPDEEA